MIKTIKSKKKQNRINKQTNKQTKQSTLIIKKMSVRGIENENL